MNILERPQAFADLSSLYNPRSVAVIGASQQPGNLGGLSVSLMLKFGYRGRIMPVHPKAVPVHGLECHASVSDLPETPDLAIIALGSRLAASVVRECAQAGIRYGILWAAGYSEVGEEGAKLQDELATLCRDTGFTLVGPNSVGIINARTAMIGSFASFLTETDTLTPGNIAIISQSGGLATMAQAMAELKGAGIGLTVSTGNEAILTISDYIHAAAHDPDIKVIATYVEGIRDGGRFLEAIGAARAAGKPVVALKGGLSAASVQAIAAHTGALAGERRVWEAVARELGVVSVSSLEELLETALYLSSVDLDTLPKGRGVAVVTFGGGAGVVSADQCARSGLTVPPLEADTVAKLRALVPPIASVRNPIDLTPQTFNDPVWFEKFPEALDTIAADPGVDIVFCQFGPQAQRGAPTARTTADLRERTGKTVLIAWPLSPSGTLEILRGEGVYVFQEYERAITAIGRIHEAGLRTDIAPLRRPPASSFNWRDHVPAPSEGLVISENECHAILSAAELNTARGSLVRKEDSASQIAAKLSYPLAAKGISSAVTHRAAAGLLALGLHDEKELEEACGRLWEKASSAGVELDGIYLQEMVSEGIEVLVSGFRDPVFGPMVSVGTGGILTELMDDVVLARAPLGIEAARSLIEPLHVAEAARKLCPGAKIDDLARFVADFSVLINDAPWASYVVEINPVKWNAAGTKAVDGLIIIDKP